MRKPKIIALAAGGLFAASLLGGCFEQPEPPDIDIPDQVCEIAPQLPGCGPVKMLGN